MTFFKHWLFLNENIEESFNKWLEMAIQHAKGQEKFLLRIRISSEDVGSGADHTTLIGKDPKNWSEEEKDFVHNKLLRRYQIDVIKQVLKEKNIENYNWFAFGLGYLATRPEDLELAIDVTKRRIDSGELPKTEIGNKGWMIIGAEAQDHVEAHIAAQQELSNRAKLKMKKKGETLGDDERYVKLIEHEKNIKVYFIPAIAKDSKPRPAPFRTSEAPDDKTLKERQMILCKYGRGTVWCTANPQGTYHQHYAKNNIYTIHVDDKPMYQFVDCNDSSNHQFMDVDNHSATELDGDVFDVLFNNEDIKSKIKCYKLSRSYSFEDLTDPEKEEKVYKNINAKNITSFLVRMNEDQTIDILRKLIIYKDPEWFNNSIIWSHTDEDRMLRSFVKKLGSQKIIDEFKDKISNNIFRNIFLSDPNSISKLVEDNLEIIKNTELTSSTIKLIAGSFLHRDTRGLREKTLKLLGPEVLNNLDENDIEQLVKENGFDTFKHILDNRTAKINVKLVDFILIKLNTLQNWDYESKFLKWLLSKDISTGAVEFILRWFTTVRMDPVLGRISSGSRMKHLPQDKIESIFEMIGSDRITKIKKLGVLAIAKEIEIQRSRSEKEDFLDLIKKYHKKINLSSEGST